MSRRAPKPFALAVVDVPRAAKRVSSNGETVSAVPKKVATFSSAAAASDYPVVGSSVANQLRSDLIDPAIAVHHGKNMLDGAR